MKINQLKAKPPVDPFAKARYKMVDTLRRKGIRDEGVLGAMAAIPRHLFVEQALQTQAYDDHPLPIGSGQTISQPYMVALMTNLLGLNKQHRVLEIGAGSGYQTAILAFLAGRVYAIERLPNLARRAHLRLRQLGLENVVVKAGDGTLGWPEEAPFDASLVAACSPDIPPALVEQLTVGGRLVIPVGDEKSQRLILFIRGDNHNDVEDHGGCVFVKLLGKYGWQE